MSQFTQAFRRYGQNGAANFFINSMDNTVALEAMLPVKLGFASDAAIARGIPAAAAATLLDPYTFQDTPGDTLDHIHWSAVMGQQQSLLHLLLGPANAPGALTDSQFYGRAQLQILAADQPFTLFQYSPGESLPQLKAPGALIGGESEIYAHPLGDPLAGTRRTDWYLTHADGTVVIESVCKAQEAEFRLQAFEFDHDGRIILALAANQGDARNMVANFSPESDKPRAGMLFDCSAAVERESASGGDHLGAGILDAYGLFDPRYLDYLEQIQVLDARRLDEAQFVNVYARQGVAAIFMPPAADIRWQLLASRGNVNNRMVLLNADVEHPAGTGFSSTDIKSLGPLAWRTAQDFSALDVKRKADLEKFGISNDVIRDLQTASQRELTAGKSAETARDYPALSASADALWSLQSQEYQNLIETSNGIIHGVIFLLLGVIPFSYFLERLLVGSPNVYRQIAWFAGIFACMTLGLWFHPAFRISSAPLMILLAFMILILSGTVVYILWGKFEEELRRLRGAAGHERHAASFRRGAVIGAAIRLGLSNMRRRGLRTGLTLTTLVLLTFTLLCFTSVRESVQISPHQIPFWAGRPAPGAALLLRQRGWQTLPVETLQFARGIAASEAPALDPAQSPVSPRWWVASEHAEQPWQLPVSAAGGTKSYLVSGLIGIDPAEAQFEPESEIVRIPADCCRLPAQAQITLGIKVGDTVSIMGYQLHVAGFFTPAAFDELRQITGDPFSPLDPAGTKIVLSQGVAQPLRSESTYRFMDAISIAVIPGEIAERLSGRLTSIILRPRGGMVGGGGEGRNFSIEDAAISLARRSAFTVYVSTGAEGAGGGRVLSINAAEASRPQDLGVVVIPMVIAGIIVLNTMLGAVSERTREIHVYTSVGLSPAHIGMLFLAEAAALGTLGVVFGYIFGQALATFFSWTHLLPGVQLNYSSMSAIITMGLVLGIVMLSALWPALAASRLATPSLQRDWKLPSPVGDLLCVDLPFTVNQAAAQGVLAFLAEFLTTTTSAGTGRFTADNLSASSREGTQGITRTLSARIWLAPYDLGVIQMMHLSVHPTDQPAVFEVQVQLTREAGNPGAWRRLNRAFLVDIRKQFLLWRGLHANLVAHYVQSSTSLMDQSHVGGVWE
jgi:hypothetical protein